ncbi:MAG: DUF1934 domain-containing protein [Oscillospiraceae bacterium]|nr:DUF1934 domain-containing protein [Oscillospiraceae bacterium]
MNKDVSINIKAVQVAANESDTTELFTCGNLMHKRGDYTLSYHESAATGYEGSKVSLDITGDNMVVMRRSGDATASLIIEKGKKHHCHYGTPYGDFMVGISADDVRCNLDESGGDMYLKYTIDINSTLMSENEMFIDFKTIDANKEVDS